jgi:cellulose synthase/poly-beta-1,6-N-acetylglucosamine synthase-like glycosyltransferase
MLALLLSWPVWTLGMATIAAIRQDVPARSTPKRSRNYWIIIPALNEAKVIRNTVHAALALHSVRSPVRVLVIDDGSDDETPEILSQLAHPRLFVLRRDYPQARQGKGPALNAGFRMIRDRAVAENVVDSTIVGVIDADGAVKPNTINDLVDAYFADPAVGGVQCRVRIKDRRWILGFLQDIEFTCVANAAQTFRDLVDSVGLGGNGQFVRLPALMRLGEAPWSRCLVEDLELGLRLHLAGVHIRYSSVAVVHQQGIVHIGKLIRQRARWAQGNLQCARHLLSLSGSRRVGSLGLVDYFVYLVSPWLTVPLSIIVLGVIGLVIWGLVTENTLGGLIATGPAVSAALGVWLTVIFLPGVLWGLWHRWQVGDEPLWRCLLAGLCYPFFLMIGVVATWRGMAQHLAGGNGWAKTERRDEAQLPVPNTVGADRSRH